MTDERSLRLRSDRCPPASGAPLRARAQLEAASAPVLVRVEPRVRAVLGRLGWVALFGGALLATLHGCGGTSDVAATGGAGGVVFPGDPCDAEGTTRVCYPGSPTTRAIGECRDGTSLCSDGRWGDCVGYQVPAADDCNGRDDDCNGVIDDGCGGAGAGGAVGGTGGAGATGGTGGAGGAGGSGSPLRLYHRDFYSNTSTFVTEPVADAWTGPNAPDADSVVAVEASYGTPLEWLFAISTDGQLYRRSAGMWLVPLPFATTFVGPDAAAVNTLTIWQPQAGGPQSFQITTRSSGTVKLAYDFTVTLPAFTVTPGSNNPIVIPDDPNPAAPPHYMVDMDWQFSHQTAHLGTPQWVLFYLQCGVDAYLLDGGNATWADLGPAQQSFIWGGNPAAGPAAATVRAAWLEDQELYLLAP